MTGSAKNNELLRKLINNKIKAIFSNCFCHDTNLQIDFCLPRSIDLQMTSLLSTTQFFYLGIEMISKMHSKLTTTDNDYEEES